MDQLSIVSFVLFLGIYFILISHELRDLDIASLLYLVF